MKFNVRVTEKILESFLFSCNMRKEEDRKKFWHPEGLTFEEIAQRLDLPSADAARKRYARCLAALREKWRP